MAWSPSDTIFSTLFKHSHWLIDKIFMSYAIWSMTLSSYKWFIVKLIKSVVIFSTFKFPKATIEFETDGKKDFGLKSRLLITNSQKYQVNIFKCFSHITSSKPFISNEFCYFHVFFEMLQFLFCFLEWSYVTTCTGVISNTVYSKKTQWKNTPKTEISFWLEFVWS